jgi:hypothetical protein
MFLRRVGLSDEIGDLVLRLGDRVEEVVRRLAQRPGDPLGDCDGRDRLDSAAIQVEGVEEFIRTG